MVNYIENIQINKSPISLNSPVFHGQWVEKSLSIFASQSFPNKQNQYVDYSLEGYLPNDGFDYEVIFCLIVNTASPVNSTCYCWLCSGKEHSLRGRASTVVTRVANPESCAGQVCLPIKANDRYVSVYFESGNSNNTGKCWLNAYAYRRIGTNQWNIDNSITGLKFANKEFRFGGDLVDGPWVFKQVTLWSNVTLQPKSGNIVTVDLSQCVPNDGKNYTCLIDGTATTSNVINTYESIRVKTNSTNDWMTLMEQITRAAGTRLTYFNMYFPLSGGGRSIQLKNTGSTVSTCNLRFCAYRRIGNND